MPPKKDPNKPKGRTSAYAFFVKEKRAEKRDMGQEVEFTSFSRECSELWKDMREDKKRKYFRSAEEDRQRYEEEMGNYVPKDDGTGRRGKRKRNKRQKDPNMPKRAMSAFFWFAQDKRPKLKEQNPSATVGDIAKQLGAAWKIMTPEQKSPYEKSAKEDRRRYDKDMEEYRKKAVSGQADRRDDDEEEEEEEEYSDEDD